MRPEAAQEARLGGRLQAHLAEAAGEARKDAPVAVALLRRVDASVMPRLLQVQRGGQTVLEITAAARRFMGVSGAVWDGPAVGGEVAEPADFARHFRAAMEQLSGDVRIVQRPCAPTGDGAEQGIPATRVAEALGQSLYGAGARHPTGPEAALQGFLEAAAPLGIGWVWYEGAAVRATGGAGDAMAAVSAEGVERLAAKVIPGPAGAGAGFVVESGARPHEALALVSFAEHRVAVTVPGEQALSLCALWRARFADEG